jgi:hypothetical protein
MPRIKAGAKNRVVIGYKHNKPFQISLVIKHTSSVASKRKSVRTSSRITKSNNDDRSLSIRDANARFIRDEDDRRAVIEIARAINAMTSKRTLLERLVRKIDKWIFQVWPDVLNAYRFEWSNDAKRWLWNRLVHLGKLLPNSTVFVRGPFPLSSSEPQPAWVGLLASAQKDVLAVASISLKDDINASKVRDHSRTSISLVSLWEMIDIADNARLLCVQPASLSLTHRNWFFDVARRPSRTLSLDSTEDKHNTRSDEDRDIKSQCWLESWYTQSFYHLVQIARQSRDVALLVLEYSVEPLEDRVSDDLKLRKFGKSLLKKIKPVGIDVGLPRRSWSPETWWTVHHQWRL